jgi:Bacteriophage related domain of unknown function
MVDYAGAVAAIRSRFVSLWVDEAGNRRTPIAFPNEPKTDAHGQKISPWPPQAEVNGERVPIPWVYFEVLGNDSSLRGAGTPGDNIWLYTGGIYIHVFMPEGYGTEDAQQLAVTAGEIFRAKTFYQDGRGAKVVSMSPRTDGGASDADNGNWFRVPCYVPFEFFYRG